MSADAPVGQAPRSVAEATAANKSFSRQLPGLQLAVDSTSLGTFKECPRKYYYSVIQGWQPRTMSVHLQFGILVHGARERYDHRRAEGASHDEALRAVVRWLMVSTWDKKLQRPLTFESQTKTRLSLVRTMVNYLDKWGDNDPLETIILANGRPAVELSFSFALGLRSVETDEPFMACGHMDRLVKFNGSIYVADVKTTESQISPWWFQRFSPDNQFSMYTLAGKVVYEVPVAGVLVDGVQILAQGNKFERQIAARSATQVDEFLASTHWWLGVMEQSASRQHWPQNEKSCGYYGGCQFRSICSKPPAAREQWLATEFVRRQWDPLQRRGNPEG